ncbi:MAG TPA: winged helix-turn-helix domain-containing protein [Gammaproteobacteria bacterium]
MKQDDGLAGIGALLADRSRSAMLMLLMDGRAYTAGELARAAGIAPATASHHLDKLLHAGFLERIQQGRNRYFRIAANDVAGFIENALAVHEGLALGKIPTSCPARLRKARMCYDHLAGECSVRLLDMGLDNGMFASDGVRVLPGERSAPFLAALGIDASTLHGKFCLDWSERRFHLAGPLAATITRHLIDDRWFLRGEKRELVMTEKGKRGMAAWFSL